MRRASRRFGLSILNYTVTSNHIHLMVLDDGPRGAIARAMHLVSGMVALEFNARKKRHGAFWEDRYHATAVDTDIYLLRGLFYIDLNMVRAGVVKNPGDWPYGGFREISAARRRYCMIDKPKLCRLLKVDPANLARHYQGWLADYLKNPSMERESRWTESLAVGSDAFVEGFKSKMGLRGRYRTIKESDGSFELREGGPAGRF